MDAPLPQDFIAQAEELIDSLFADIQALRRAATLTGRDRRALVDRTFRHAHTLKGTASALPQLEAASRLAHELENLLDAVRAGRTATGDRMLDACEDAIESLARSLEAAARAVPAPDASETIERLRRLSTTTQDAQSNTRTAPHASTHAPDALTNAAHDASTHAHDASSGEASDASPLDMQSRRSLDASGASPLEAGSSSHASFDSLPEEIAALLNAQERRRLAEVCAEGARLVVVDVAFDLADLDEKFRQLSDALAASAEIVSTLPGARADAAPAQIGFRLLCATDAPEKLSPLQATFDAQLTELSATHTGTKAHADAPQAAVFDESTSAFDEPSSVAHDERASAAPSANGESPEVATPSTSSFVRVQLSELDDLIFAANELFDDAMRALDAGRAPALAGVADPVLVSADVENAGATVAGVSGAGVSGAGVSDAAVSGAGVASTSDDAAVRVRQNLVALVERVMALRMQTLARTLERAARTARVSARRMGKRIEVEIEGGDARVDRAVAERISEPLAHLLRNAVAHGIESPVERRKQGKSERGRVWIEAATEGSRVRIRVSDDGRGIDVARVAATARSQGLVEEGASVSEAQALRLIFRPGFSTAPEVSLGSGRGVGLDAVEHEIEQAGGEVRVRTRAGRGTTFELRLPLALALAPAVLVQSGAHAYAIEASRVVETMPLEVARTSEMEGRQTLRWRDARLPLVALRDLLGQTTQAATNTARRQRDDPNSNNSHDDATGSNSHNDDAHVGDLHARDSSGESSGVESSSGESSGGDARFIIIVRADDTRADDARADSTRDGDGASEGAEQPQPSLVAIVVEQVLRRREVLIRSLGRHATRWRGVSGAIDLRDGTVAVMLDLPRLLEGKVSSLSEG